jgi:N-acetyltransferase
MNKLSMQNSTPIQPITLTGRWVRVEPLALAHTARLVEVCRHAEIWRYLRAELKTEDDVRAWIAAALDEQQKGNELPFAIIDLQSGRVVGSTRYFTIALKDPAVEIGSTTWLTLGLADADKLGSQVSAF